MSSNEIEFCNFAAKQELNGVMWRRGYALFVFWLILGECSKMSIAIRNCGQSTNTNAISTPFDVIWALSISHSNELKRDEACSRTIATTSIFPPHFRKFRINLIVKQRLLLKCYFSCTENRPSNSIGRLCCCSNSSNKNEWIQKRATKLSHPLVTECENMNPHIHSRHPAKCTVVVESLVLQNSAEGAKHHKNKSRLYLCTQINKQLKNRVRHTKPNGPDSMHGHDRPKLQQWRIKHCIWGSEEVKWQQIEDKMFMLIGLFAGIAWISARESCVLQEKSVNWTFFSLLFIELFCPWLNASLAGFYSF